MKGNIKKTNKKNRISKRRNRYRISRKSSNNSKNSNRNKTRTISKKRTGTRRIARRTGTGRNLTGGGCCGENNYYSGSPFDPSKWNNKVNHIQTFYPFNKNVIDPPVPEGQAGGGILPYDITNAARGMVEGVKGMYYGWSGLTRPDNSYVSPTKHLSLERENNKSLPPPEPINIEKIHADAALQI